MRPSQKHPVSPQKAEGSTLKKHPERENAAPSSPRIGPRGSEVPKTGMAQLPWQSTQKRASKRAPFFLCYLLFCSSIKLSIILDNCEAWLTPAFSQASANRSVSSRLSLYDLLTNPAFCSYFLVAMVCGFGTTDWHVHPSASHRFFCDISYNDSQ